ncbi:hypothetical protein R83H12_01059 [Fibrobacteria bacterium R8-3-H12]
MRPHPHLWRDVVAHLAAAVRIWVLGDREGRPYATAHTTTTTTFILSEPGFSGFKDLQDDTPNNSVGTFAPAAQSSCTALNAGECVLTSANQTAQTACEIIDFDKIAEWPDGTLFIGKGNDCGSGLYSNSDTRFKCVRCPEGAFCPNQSNGLLTAIDKQLCGAGKWSNMGAINNCDLATTCGTLPAQSNTTWNGPCAKCPAGFYCDGNGNKTGCPAGSYCPEGSSAPTTCPTGSMCPTAELSANQGCAAGTYQDETGKTSCKTCPAGSYCPAGSESAISCPAGLFCLEGASSATADGSLTGTCPAGSFSTGGATTANCTPCASGSANNGTGKTTACDSCQAGYWQANTGALSCDDCGLGYACPNTGMSTRNACGAGTSSEGSSTATSCTNCANGTFSSGSVNGTCESCDAGTISNGQPTSLNTTAHDYGEEFAEKVLVFLPVFVSNAKNLSRILKEAK